MSYLFSFGGRINRAKIWLFILIAIVWWLVIAAVAVFGLHWSHFIGEVRAFKATLPRPAHPPLPYPDPVGGNGWIAVAAVTFLVVTYIWAKLAIFVKRLHDRNKGAWWIVPYWLLPLALQVYARVHNHSFALRPTDITGLPQQIAVGVAMLIGLWVFVELYFFRGTHGDNRFGPDPLA